MAKVRVNAGELSHSVALQQRTTSKDDIGGIEGTWATIETTFCGIRPASAFERQVAMQTGQEITHKIKMRYNPNLTVGMRLFVQGSRVFDVKGVVNVEERNLLHEVTALERDDVDN